MQVLEIAPYLDTGWVVLGRIDDRLLVRRFSYDGQLDSDFGEQGTASFLPNGQPCSSAPVECGIAVETGGKIIVVGTTRVGGDLDESFADNGKFSEAWDGDYFSLRALTQLPDGDLLAVGGFEGDCGR